MEVVGQLELTWVVCREDESATNRESTVVVLYLAPNCHSEWHHSFTVEVSQHELSIWVIRREAFLIEELSHQSLLVELSTCERIYRQWEFSGLSV